MSATALKRVRQECSLNANLGQVETPPTFYLCRYLTEVCCAWRTHLFNTWFNTWCAWLCILYIYTHTAICTYVYTVWIVRNGQVDLTWLNFVHTSQKIHNNTLLWIFWLVWTKFNHVYTVHIHIASTLKKARASSWNVRVLLSLSWHSEKVPYVLASQQAHGWQPRHITWSMTDTNVTMPSPSL